ncbi:hypothetical protein [Arthrobacter methylotrophus]|uniref:Uncharacterized protein n=1 Tax=Arthrobacter methylotrophus TaxID=121291 RepID=A0ABV5UNS2_9MICC
MKSEAGAINVTGALVGIIVTGTVGGVAATSSNGMIQTAQDMAARQNAAQVGTAQELAKIMDGRYTDLAGLEADGHMPAYRAAAGPRRFATQSGAGGTCFVIVSRSVTGRTYFATDLIPAPEPLEPNSATDLIPAPEPLEPNSATGCLLSSQVQDMARSLEEAAAATSS